MNDLSRWMLTCLLLLVPAAAALAEVPSWIQAPAERGASPIWMSAEEATTAEGELRSELFSSLDEMNVRRHLESQREARNQAGLVEKTGADTCQSWIFIPPSPVVAEPTLEALLDHAKLAFVGTVEDQKQGFYHGHPNSLLEIRVETVLKAPEGYEDITSVYATYPHVEMKIGGEMVCMRSDRYPARPLTGKGIMVFAANIPDWDPLIVAPNTEVVLFEDESGNAVLPERFGKVLDPPSWTSLVRNAVVSSAVGRAGRGVRP